MRVARLFLFADWPEKYFSGQSEGGISNASGTRSVRVSAQGFSRSCCKLSPMKIPSSRLAAPGSPRMHPCYAQSHGKKNMSPIHCIFQLFSIPFILYVSCKKQISACCFISHANAALRFSKERIPRAFKDKSFNVTFISFRI